MADGNHVSTLGDRQERDAARPAFVRAATAIWAGVKDQDDLWGDLRRGHVVEVAGDDRVWRFRLHWRLDDDTAWVMAQRYGGEGTGIAIWDQIEGPLEQPRPSRPWQYTVVPVTPVAPELRKLGAR